MDKSRQLAEGRRQKVQCQPRHYSLPAICYLLPATRYLLPATSYLLLATCYLLLAPPVHAYQETVWDFRGDIPGRFEGKGLASPQVLDEGMLVLSPTEGNLVRPTNIDHKIESVEIEYASTRDTLFRILWEPKNKPGALLGIPMALPATNAEYKTLGINVGGYQSWNPRTPKLGLGFGPDTEIIVSRLIFKQYSLPEKLTELVKSFWWFDVFSGTSVNFLWGPMLAANPVGRTLMWDELPPRAFGVTWLFMAAAGGALLVCLTQTEGRLRRAAPLVLCAALGLYELRMGSELLNYARKDALNYVFAAPGERRFRAWGPFAETAISLRRILRDEPEITVVHKPDAPLNILQYNLLPTRVRSWKPGDASPITPYFIIFEYPEAKAVSDSIVVDGVTFAEHAQLVEDFGQNILLYRRL